MRAVVWDLDGVIVDSGDAHNASWVGMAHDFGVPYNPQTDFKGIFGRHNTDIITSLWHVTAPDQIASFSQRSAAHDSVNLSIIRSNPSVISDVIGHDI